MVAGVGARMMRSVRRIDDYERLLVAVGDSASVEVVWAELDLHLVAGEDADVVAAHLARDVPEDLVVILELHLEHRVGQGLKDLALHLDLLFLAHAAGDSSSGHKPRRKATCPGMLPCRARP